MVKISGKMESSAASLHVDTEEEREGSGAVETHPNDPNLGRDGETAEVLVETERLYPCQKCNQNFPDRSLVSSHTCPEPVLQNLLMAVELSEESITERYMCPLCAEIFPLPNSLKKHFRAHRAVPSRLLSCPEPGCMFDTPDWRQYQKHMRSVHSLVPVPCSFRTCRLAFRNAEEMEAHWRGHFPFHCHCCDFVTANAKIFCQHRREHDQPRPSKDETLHMHDVEGEARQSGNISQLPAQKKRKRLTLVNKVPNEEEDEGNGMRKKKSKRHVEERSEGSLDTTNTSRERYFKGDIAEGTEHLYRTHICPECRRCFKKRTHLVEHLHLHFPDPTLQCPKCQRFFTSKSKLNIHMLREAGQKSHHCHLCDYSAVERNSLTRHLASVHEDKPNFYSDVYPCPSCGEQFRLSHALKEHMKTHHSIPEQKALACFEAGCRFETQDKKDFQRHTKETHGVTVAECRHHACSALFKSENEMEAHFRMHAAFHCSQCHFTCSNKHAYRQHKRQGHPGTEELRCSFCNFTSFNPVEFSEHVSRLHAHEKTHRCSDCSFATAHKRVLSRHMLLHTGEKPHKCKLCDFTCRDVSYLSKHMLTHSDDKNYMCSECGYITKWKQYLNVHMRKHTGDLRYQCNQCSYCCHRADQLSSHKLRHQDKSLICEVCAFACKRKYELRRHMQVKHSQGGNCQSPVFQCKFCSYNTHYRQALLNHENCKHTRQREFRCALCSYYTFSNTSLFFHKRKAHGYVPGDKVWLENYKQHESDNNASQIQLGYCENIVGLPSNKEEGSAKGLRASEELGGIQGESIQETEYIGQETIQVWAGNCSLENGNQKPLDNCSLDNYNQGLSSAIVRQELPSEICDLANCSQEWTETCPANNSCKENAIRDNCTRQEPNDEREFCTILLTQVSNVELEDPNCSQGKAEKERGLMAADSPVPPMGTGSKLLPETEAIDHPLCKGSEEEGVGGSESEEPIDASEGEVPLRVHVGIGESQIESEQDSALMDSQEEEDTVDSIVLEGSSEKGLPMKASGSQEGEMSHSECVLKALRKQDKEQATTLVLEGRVQMLVVQNKASVFKCDQCSYVTKKQTSLSLHCRMRCRARKAHLQCGECGAVFKQQRGLDTHRLKKCPVHLKKNRRFARPLTAGQPSSKKLGESEQAVSLTGEASTNQAIAKLSELNQIRTGELETLASVEATSHSTLEQSNCTTAANCAPMASLHDLNAQEEPGTVLGEEENVASIEREATNSPLSFTTSPQRVGDLEGYRKDDGKFRCNRCLFACSRLSTIKRHCASCSSRASTTRVLRSQTEKRGRKKKMEEEEYDDDDDDDKEEVEDDEDDDYEQEEENKNLRKNRISCSTCPFTCHQKRALASHRKRGCLKPGEFQCQLCSFVGKSITALKSHKIVHNKKNRLTTPSGKKARLRCELCPFTCKQERCLRQHVALKHEGLKPHTCHYCDFRTTRRYRLDAHESLHTGVGRISCDQCDQTFGTNSKMRLHRQRVHEKQPTHFCQLCDYSGYSANDVTRHTLCCHTGELCYTCTDCPAGFSSETALKQHSQRLHQKTTSMVCPHCDFSCRSEATLKSHVQRKHPQLQCPSCQASFETRESLEEHRKTHFSQRCTLCSFAARERQLLVEHLMDEHEDGPPSEKPLKCAACGFACRHQLVFEQHVRSHGGTRLYKCTDCQYSTRNRQKITWHTRIHTGEKPYRCEQCSYACADPSRLKYHMRTHQDERKYLCPECGYKCKWVNQLKYHMTKHTGAKPYRCEECEYCTNRADALRVHQETRHRETRSFICEQCGKGFKTRFLLKTHMKKHSEERPYVCRVCQRAFRWAAGLRHHYLTHTKQHPFYCLHCSYRAKQRFQVVKHLQRHHPDRADKLDHSQGVGKDPGPHTVPLQQAMLEGQQ